MLSSGAKSTIFNLLSVVLTLFNESTLGDPLVSFSHIDMNSSGVVLYTVRCINVHQHYKFFISCCYFTCSDDCGVFGVAFEFVSTPGKLKNMVMHAFGLWHLTEC